MHSKQANQSVSAWDLGDLAYDLGDTMEIGIMKAANVGIRSGSNGYAAFITAFSRRVRSREVSPAKQASGSIDPIPTSSAHIISPDFQRSPS